jgi:predicted nucleic acid-binding Zn ribbon protein
MKIKKYVSIYTNTESMKGIDYYNCNMCGVKNVANSYFCSNKCYNNFILNHRFIETAISAGWNHLTHCYNYMSCKNDRLKSSPFCGECDMGMFEVRCLDDTFDFDHSDCLTCNKEIPHNFRFCGTDCNDKFISAMKQTEISSILKPMVFENSGEDHTDKLEICEICKTRGGRKLPTGSITCIFCVKCYTCKNLKKDNDWIWLYDDFFYCSQECCTK